MAYNQNQFNQEYSERLKQSRQIGQAASPKPYTIEKYLESISVKKQQKTPRWTSEDLYDLAVQSGLKDQADTILAQKGEEVNQIFSGGWISDIFDALNVLQYGVVGMLKGKSFIEGVKNRESFSKQDSLGDYGIPGMIAGTLLDIAVDPLTYIAPWTLLKKVPGITKGLTSIKESIFGKMVTKTIQETPELENAIEAGKKIADAVPEVRTYQTVEGGTKIGRWLGDRFVYRFGQDPVFAELDNRRIKNILVDYQNVMEAPANMLNLSDKSAKWALKVGKDGRIARTSPDVLQKLVDAGKLTQDEFNIIQKANNSIIKLGQIEVDLGILSKEKFEENINDYLHNFYKEYIKKPPSREFGYKQIGIKGTKKRVKGLTREEMEGLGQVKNPAYLYLRTQIEMLRDIENAKFFKKVAKRLGSDIEQEGFKMLPATRRLGDLSGKWVPEHIYNAIQEITKPADKTLGNKIIGAFKYSKVVLNPATHARNIASNAILNWWKLGMNPLDPKVISVQAEAAKQIAKGGKWIDEARQLGYNLNTFAANELPNLLESPEAYKVLGSKAGKLADKIGNLYQGEEGFAKLSAYIFSRKHKGLAPEEAWKAAESATFNYSQVTPFVRQLRTSLWGYPFITFPLKATPVAIETMAKHPGRVSVFGKIKQSIENQADITETEAERAVEPSWIRDGFYIKLPMKDSEGRSAYFDLTYIIPFGDLVSGTLFTRQVNRETGLPESVPETLLSPSPVFNALKELHQNQDFYGNKIWKESDPVDKQLKDLFTYISKTFLPTPIADQLPGGYKTTGEKQPGRIQRIKTPKTEPDQQRTMMEEMLRNVGLKIQPIDLDIQETYMEAEKKRALERLLTEAGILSEFKTVYIPKE